MKQFVCVSSDLILSYMLRQLASDGPGFPIFEIYFAEANGAYHLQVHLLHLIK
jgi:hypothetical protein